MGSVFVGVFVGVFHGGVRVWVWTQNRLTRKRLWIWRWQEGKEVVNQKVTKGYNHSSHEEEKRNDW